jgi:hypothetical protein
MIEQKKQDISIKDLMIIEPARTESGFDPNNYFTEKDLDNYWKNSLENSIFNPLWYSAQMRILAPHRLNDLKIPKTFIARVGGLRQKVKSENNLYEFAEYTADLYKADPRLRQNYPVTDWMWKRMVKNMNDKHSYHMWWYAPQQYEFLKVIRPNTAIDLGKGAVNGIKPVINGRGRPHNDNPLRDYLQIARSARIALPDRPDVWMPDKTKWEEIKNLLSDRENFHLDDQVKPGSMEQLGSITYFELLTNATILAAQDVIINESGIEIVIPKQRNTNIYGSQIPERRRF